jgi:hypothetical protein
LSDEVADLLRGLVLILPAMMPRRSTPICFLLGAVPLLSSCSRPEETGWPTRNYSGIYSVRARVVSNSCEAPVFASGDTLLLTLFQTRDNRARVELSPVVTVDGAFMGDRLEARAAIPTPALSLPPADSGATSPATPGDSLRYRLELDFEGETFEGRYRVEQPPLGGRVEACSQEFQLEGTEVVRHRPWEGSPGS